MLCGVFGLLALLCCPHIDPELREAYQQTLQAWHPYRATIRAVRWDEDEACNDKWGGGRFLYTTREIIVCDPVQHDLFLIIVHEYGHALGLHHVDRDERISIMNSGWEEPYGTEVTAEDLAAVAKKRAKR